MICDKCAHKFVCALMDEEDELLEECENFASFHKIRMSDEDRKEQQRILHRRYYDERKNAKLCVDCGKPVIKGKTKCEEHLQRDRELQQKRKNKLKQQGLCPNCGKPKYKNKVLCYECYLKQKRYVAENRQPTFRELGLCMNCGKKEPIKGHPYCAECYEWRKEICLKTLFNEDGTHKYPMKEDHPWKRKWSKKKE